MMNPYYNYDFNYGSPSTFIGYGAGMVIAIITAIILATVLYFTFLSKKNEGKFTGAKEKLYNFLTFNRFYLEEILKFLYVVVATVLTVVGIALILMGRGLVGILVATVGNVMVRITYELLMMFIVLCKKAVSIERKLNKISDFYGDDFGEDFEEKPFDIDDEPGDNVAGGCETCQWQACDGCDGEEMVEIATEKEEIDEPIAQREEADEPIAQREEADDPIAEKQEN